MQIGKLPNNVLNKLIIEPINEQSPSAAELLSGPSVGEDCALLDLGENLLLVSTDPITAAQKDAGKLLINICANDIAAAGGVPIGIAVTALFPPDSTEEDIKTVSEGLSAEAKKRNIAIIGGHTEITDAVNRIVLSGAVLGKVEKGGQLSTSGAETGDKILLTKHAGLEGAAILACEFEKTLIEKFGAELVKRVKDYSEEMSVLKEAAIAKEFGASSLHDVTEGGVLGACAEAAQACGRGFEIDLRNVNVTDETQKICDFFGISPFGLISSGALLITAKNGEELAAELERNGVKCSVIGVVTDGESTMTLADGITAPLTAPTVDSIYRAMRYTPEKSKRLIVFVCTGNTCRSPMAAGLAKSLSNEYEFTSRGMSVYGGKISENARLIMEENGIDMSGFKPSAFTRKDAVNARLILTMAESHKQMLLETYGDIENIDEKIFTLREYAYGAAGDIKDPFGQGEDYYRRCAEEMKECIEKILQKL